jgi:hypothetical protein
MSQDTSHKGIKTVLEAFEEGSGILRHNTGGQGMEVKSIINHLSA